MKLAVRHAGGELVVQSQKEFLVLYRRGFIAADDQVRRVGAPPEVQWQRADELPWIRGSAVDEKKDGRRLLVVTLVMMVLGLCGVFYIQARAARLPPKRVPSSAHPEPQPPPDWK